MMTQSLKISALAVRGAAAALALTFAGVFAQASAAVPPPTTSADKVTFAEVSHETLVWFGAHQGVSIALAVGLVALVTGIVINREPG